MAISSPCRKHSNILLQHYFCPGSWFMHDWAVCNIVILPQNSEWCICCSHHSLVSFLIALLVICASYLKIRTRLRFTTPDLEVHGRSRQSTEHNLRLFRTFFVVIALSFVFWLPAFVVYTIREFCKSCFSPLALEIVYALRLANSMVNPFVYSFRMPILKDALKQCRRQRHQDIELQPVRL